MEYLNDRYPYGRKCDAICCYYSYPDTAIIQAVVDCQKRLIISREFHFQKAPKAEIAKVLKNLTVFVNKNDYFANSLGYLKAYYLDFDDEADLEMLTDEFAELLDNNRVIYEAEKTKTKHREQCLQMAVKALNESLASGVTSFTERREPFVNPRDLHYRDYVPLKQNHPIY